MCDIDAGEDGERDKLLNQTNAMQDGDARLTGIHHQHP